MKKSKQELILTLEPCHLIKSKFMTGFDTITSKPIASRKSQDFSLHFIDTQCDQFMRNTCEDGDDDCVKGDADLPKPGWTRCLGLLFGLMACISFSLSVTTAKYLNKYHVFNLGIWRSQGVLIPSLLVFLYSKVVLKLPVTRHVWPLTEPKNRVMFGLIWARSLAGIAAVIAQYYSLKFISVADSSVIAMSTPIFVTLLAHFCLGEELGIISIIAAITTLLGVGIVSRPPILIGSEEFDSNTLIGTGLAFTAMSFSTIVFLLLRRIKKVHYSIEGTFLGGIGSLTSLILSLAFGVEALPQGLFDWLMAFALALTSFFGQLALKFAFKYEQAGPISLLRTTDIIFAFIWQWIFFHEEPDLYSVIGAVIIIATVLVVGGRKWLSTLPEDNPLRQKFRFILY